MQEHYSLGHLQIELAQLQWEIVNMDPPAGFVPAVPDINEIIRSSLTTKFVYRKEESMSDNIQRFMDGQARKANASITNNVYNSLMDSLGQADPGGIAFLDSALSTVAVTNALANQDYNAALKTLRESLLELEPNKQLTLVGFSNSLRVELSAAGKTGDPQSIYTAMVTGLKSIKRGSQQPDSNTLREIYFSNLDTNTQTIMIHTKLVHDRTEQSWQHFHRVVLDTLKEIPKGSQPQEPKHVIMAVEPQPAENKEARRETRGRDRSPEMKTYRSRSRDRERSRRPQNNYEHPQDSKNAIHRRERQNSQNIHRHRLCQRCPAGRDGRHEHLPQDCRWELLIQRNQRGGFGPVHRGGFVNERGRGGFGILRRQN